VPVQYPHPRNPAEEGVLAIGRSGPWDISEAASCFVSYRLPELYAGIERKPATFPVQYLGANVPQAWAAGSVFHLLQAILGLQADAPHNRLYVDPSLPAWLQDVALTGLKIGQSAVDLRFWREGQVTRWDVSGQRGGPKPAGLAVPQDDRLHRVRIRSHALTKSKGLRLETTNRAPVCVRDYVSLTRWCVTLCACRA
jgi:hypothetical protein